MEHANLNRGHYKKPAVVIDTAGQGARRPEKILPENYLLLHNSLHGFKLNQHNRGLPITVRLYYKQDGFGRACLGSFERSRNKPLHFGANVSEPFWGIPDNCRKNTGTYHRNIKRDSVTGQSLCFQV
jgi:hypothetical protein